MSELGMHFDAMVLAAILDDVLSSNLVWQRDPLDQEAQDRVKKAVIDASIAAEAPGIVLRIACKRPSEALLAAALLNKLITQLEHLKVLPDKTSSGHYEFDNNSAIFVALTRKASQGGK